jgi:hypothetical protein
MWLEEKVQREAAGGKAESRGLASLLPLSTSEAVGCSGYEGESPCCNVYLGAFTRLLLVSYNITSA